jgi:aspartate-semialdehyde dehydrogenase
MSLRVAVVGATGAVGRQMVRTLEQRSFPVGELTLYASDRSAGVRLPYSGSDIEVRDVGAARWERIELALFSAGASVSTELAPKAAGAGTIVVDNSSAFRMAPDVPLVVPEINPEALRRHRNIVSNPNCTAIVAVMAAAPLHWAAGLTSLVVSSYQSVSGAGQKGVRELLEQVEKLRGQEEELGRPDEGSLPVGEVFGRTIAYNVVPRAGTWDVDGWTTEERKLVDETRKILDLPDLPVAATVVRVPVIAGHAVSAHMEFGRDFGPEDAREALASFPGVRVVDDPGADLFPTSLDAAGRDDVLVGRIRRSGAGGLSLFAVGDNLRKGAALNAVQIAELLFPS